MDQVIFGLLSLVSVIIFFVVLLCPDVIRSWLKGSRKIYYIDLSGNVRSCSDLSYALERTKVSVIKICRGLFRRRSAICGLAANNWKIDRASLGLNSQGGFGADWVEMTDRSGLPVEKALRLINKSNTLQDFMLDNDHQRNRIAELEGELNQARERLCRWHSGTQALLEVIKKDKQKYRSPAAQKIRCNLESLKTELTMWPGQWTTPAPGIDSWKMDEYYNKFKAAHLGDL